MRAALILCANSWREQTRGKFFSVTLIFGVLMLYMGALLGMLAADQELRVMMDFGLSIIDILGALAVAFAAATGLIQEMQTKTLYLILSRPIPKYVYLVGRYLGQLAAVLTMAAGMGAIHVLLLLLKGWRFEPGYLVALLGVGLKLTVTASVAMLLAMISTSVLSSLCLTGITWMMGHFVFEMRFLTTQALSGPLAKAAFGLIYLVPNFQLLNFRDRLGIADSTGGGVSALWAVLYALTYASACLAGTWGLFRRKEF